jgi:opacity protein-like surface antigen
MKKVIMMVAVALMAITTVNAQSHRWFWIGAKAGLTSSASDVQMDGDGIQGVFDGAMGYNAGLMMRLNAPLGIFSIHLQPEIMYNWQKGQFNQTNGVQQEITLNEFSIPVLAGLGMDLGLFNARVQAGPVVVFNSPAVIGGEKTEAAPIDWKDVSYTWAAGVGIDLFNFIMVDFRYLGGWNEGMEPKSFGELFNFDNVNKETDTWYVSLGIMF